jgi:protein TonB
MVPSPASQPPAGVLGACLVDSDFEFEKRAGKIKRRALVASIVLQVLVVAALVLVPLLGKGQSMAAYNPTIVPPYHRGSVARQHKNGPRPTGDRRRVACITCFLSFQPIVTRHEPERASPWIDEVDVVPPGAPDGPSIPGLNNSVGHGQPPPPPPSLQPRTIRVSGPVQQARLVRRVQPVYPPLAITTRREGRVELHAIIASDGTIQSLEVISGDPFFLPSALSAVREWRYQPTLLNGEPVEVDTHITVIYSLNHSEGVSTDRHANREICHPACREWE